MNQLTSHVATRIVVRPIEESPTQIEAWKRFVDQHPLATTDHQWGWRRILSESFGFAPHYLGAWSGQTLVGILPLFRVPRGWRRWALCSIPFGNYGGICAESEEAAQALLEEAKALLGRAGAAYLELRHRMPLADERLQARPLHTRFYLPLTHTPEHHLQQLGGKNHKRITKALHEGVRLVVRRDLDALFAIHAHTFRRLGSPCFPRRYFELILEDLPSEILFAAVGEQLIAYRLVLLFKDCLVSQFAGSLTPYLHYHPNHVLWWFEIQRAYEGGFKEIDQCRSRLNSGSADFKRTLRMAEEPLHYQYLVSDGRLPSTRSPSNPRYRWLIATWQRLPLAVTQLLGPKVVKYFA